MVRKDAPAAVQPAAAANVKVKEEHVKMQPVQKAPVKESKAKVKDTEAKEAVEQINPLLNAAQLTAELQLIYFAFDSALLSPVARATLVKNADFIKNSSVGKISIEGHCDERGSDEYNIALGERRAKAARNYLITMGVPANRLFIISYGEEKPANPGHNETAWANNRRDEFVIVK